MCRLSCLATIFEEELCSQKMEPKKKGHHLPTLPQEFGDVGTLFTCVF